MRLVIPPPLLQIAQQSGGQLQSYQHLIVSGEQTLGRHSNGSQKTHIEKMSNQSTIHKQSVKIFQDDWKCWEKWIEITN